MIFGTPGTRQYSVISAFGTLGTREYKLIPAFGTPAATREYPVTSAPGTPGIPASIQPFHLLVPQILTSTQSFYTTFLKAGGRMLQ